MYFMSFTICVIRELKLCCYNLINLLLIKTKIWDKVVVIKEKKNLTYGRVHWASTLFLTKEMFILYNNNNNFRVMLGEQRDTEFKHNIGPIFLESQS